MSAELRPTDSIRAALAGKRVFLTGATGFLGKVFLAKLLRAVPDVGRVLVLIRRSNSGGGAAERLESEIVRSPGLAPLDPPLPFERVEAIEGDTGEPFLGLSEAAFAAIARRIDVVVHCAGLVDFSPPLDDALSVNVDGARNAITLAAAARAPLLHPSTCFVSGNRDGRIAETLALGDLPDRGRTGFDGFDGEREAEIARAEVERARAEVDDPSLLAREMALHGGSPASARKAAEAHVRTRLRDAGKERARRFGFPNSYTYSKGVAEQIVVAALARGEIPAATIVRPAILESADAFPCPGWNQGANTTAPILYMVHLGHRMWPTREGNILDVLPIDMAAGAMLAILARLLEGRAAPLYHLGSGDTNPIALARCIELSGLHERNRAVPGVHPLVSLALRELLPTIPVSKKVYDLVSLPAWLRVAKLAKEMGIPIGSVDRNLKKAAAVVEEYLPFIAGPRAIYETGNVRALRAELSPEERAAVGYEPEGIDWRRWWTQVHFPGLEKWVWPELDRLTKRTAKPAGRRSASANGSENGGSAHAAAPASAPPPAPEPAPAHEGTLLDLLEATLRRDDGALILERLDARAVRARVASGAARLRDRGIRAGDRVALCSENSPDWALSYFAILAAGATAIPLDATLAGAQVASLCRLGKARALYASARRREVFGKRLAGGAGGGRARAIEPLPLEDLVAPSENGAADFPDDFARDPEAPASLIFTSGTTGAPKGVLLPHRAFRSQVAALATVYELAPEDRILSVLPLHHAFEFTCGLLLPLAAGARISFAAAATPEAIRAALRRVRPTAMIAVPALLEAFLRAMRREVRALVPEPGRNAAEKAFVAAVAGHRALRDRTGLNLGRKLFARAHEAFGGSLRLLVSGGASLPRASFEALRGHGYDVYAGYRLTEAGPVVTACRPGRTPRAGSVGEPIPGAEARLSDGGEILVRGPGLMLGYDGDAAATAAAIDEDGWLHTGDLGRFDADGALSIAGRSKDVIVDAAGNTTYPDEVEQAYADIPDVTDLGVARVRLPGEDGKEVVGALVHAREGASRAAILDRLKSVGEGLPFPKRLKVVRFSDGPLPRTATRKVKRDEVSRTLAAILEAERARPARADAGALPPSGPDAPDVAAGLRARRLVAAIAGRDPTALSLETRLEEDLGLDSLARVELAAAVQEETRRPLDLESVKSISDLAHLLTPRSPLAPAPSPPPARALAPSPDPAPPALPNLVRRAGNSLLTWLQKKAYEGPLRTAVEGRAHIPAHTNALVVANHCSHLDLGLVKHALGEWGRHAASLGARDYFFSTPLRKFYFENFTEVLPLDRQDLSRERLDAVVERLLAGETVIIFPEGTRSTTGEMGPFRPGLGYLVMKARVGVLPLHLDGTHAALPKGASIPRSRDLGVRIGDFLPYEDLAGATEGLTRHEAYRAIGERVRGAIEGLRDGRTAPAPASPAGVAALLEALPGRHQPGRIDSSKTFYLKFGEGDADRYTIALSPARCAVQPGKGGGPADCVVKTTPEVLTKLLRDGELPSFEDIATGAFKTSDPDALRLLVEALGLAARAVR